MSGPRNRELPGARIDDDVHHLDELPGRDLADDHVVGRLQEVAGVGMLAGQRTEHELRHRHVGSGFDAVTRHVAEGNRETSVVELHEVVDVPADLDTCRRLVRCAELQPRELGNRLRQQRPLHGVRELLLLLVETSVVDRERRLSTDAHGFVHRLPRDGRARTHREDRQ